MSDKAPANKRSREIPLRISNSLWGLAAGRCQFKGCNKPLYQSELTREECNIAEKAHIYAVSKNGPRGDSGISCESINQLENLMLLCSEHHTLVDRNVRQYPADKLIRWKKEHEERIKTITEIAPDSKSHRVLYGANIGKQKTPLCLKEIHASMLEDERYPDRTICLRMKWEKRDNSESFWREESENLELLFDRDISRLMTRDGQTRHFTLFALAPIPLLIKLGALFTDKATVETRQRTREPAGWSWQTFPEGFRFTIEKPKTQTKNQYPVALVVSISDAVPEERVVDVMGENVSIWTLTASCIGNDVIRHRDQLSSFRQKIRELTRMIKQHHGHQTPLHIFPAMPISCAVEMGRARMPKADMPWIIYDLPGNQDGFMKAIELN